MHPESRGPVNGAGNPHKSRVNIASRCMLRLREHRGVHASFTRVPTGFHATAGSLAQEVRAAMVVSEALLGGAQRESTRVPTTVVMPSQRHSVLAKARRYRGEPDRLLHVTDNPLTLVINGFNANHTVVGTAHGLICSCERFRRGGGPCAHVLAVEQRFGASDGNMTPVEAAEFVARALAPLSGNESCHPACCSMFLFRSGHRRKRSRAHGCTRARECG